MTDNKVETIMARADYIVKGKKLIKITLELATKMAEEDKETTDFMIQLLEDNGASPSFIKLMTQGIKKDAKIVVNKKGRKYITYKTYEVYSKFNTPFYDREETLYRWAVNKYLIK